MMAFVLLWPFLVWIVFLFAASGAVRKKLTMPASFAGKSVITFVAFLIIFGQLTARFFFEEKAYFFVPFLILLTAFLFLYNRKIYGFAIAGLGFFLNAFVMMINGFKMPMISEFFPFVESALYSPITEKTVFPWLADCLFFNLSSGVIVFSPGDILIAIGLLTAVVYLTFVLAGEKALAKTPNQER